MENINLNVASLFYHSSLTSIMSGETPAQMAATWEGICKGRGGCNNMTENKTAKEQLNAIVLLNGKKKTDKRLFFSKFL